MMTTAKEYTIPELTYGGSKHSGKVLVDRADYYASMAREAVLQARVDALQAAAKEMLRIAGIANQGSNAYNRSIINLHSTLNAAPPTPKLQPWVCALCDQQHMDGEVCVEAMARNGVEQ